MKLNKCSIVAHQNMGVCQQPTTSCDPLIYKKNMYTAEQAGLKEVFLGCI